MGSDTFEDLATVKIGRGNYSFFEFSGEVLDQIEQSNGYANFFIKTADGSEKN